MNDIDFEDPQIMDDGKINLLQITHDLNIGGLQQVVVNLCQALDKNRFNITVLCLRDKGPFAQEIENLGIDVSLLPQTEGVDYFAFFKVADYIKENNIHVVHTHNTQPFFDGTMASIFCGVKTVVHTDHARQFPDRMRYMVAEKLMSLYAYKVVGCSEHTTNNLHKYEKISPKKLTTIENGIVGGRFDIDVDVEKYKTEFGIPSHAPVLGACARFSEPKGIEFLIRAMPEILQSNADAVLLLAGEGELEEDLKSITQQLQLEKHVIFSGPRSDIPQLLKVFDICVLPSISEGLPMSLLEAMAARCPIVASRVGGIPKVLNHEKQGLLVEPANPSELATAIVRLLADESLQASLVEQSYQLFHQQYSATNMANAYTRLYLREAS